MRTDLAYKVLLRYKLWQAKKRKKRMEAEARKLNAKKTNKYGNKIKKAGTTIKAVNAMKPASKAPSTTTATSASSANTVPAPTNEPVLQKNQTEKAPET